MAMVVAWMFLAAGTSLATPHAHATSAASFVMTVVMWQTMIVAMMTPTVLPWLTAYARLVAPADATTTPWMPIAAFAGGYFAIWLVYSTMAAGVQSALQATGALDMSGLMSTRSGGMVLAAAGVAQFLPLKQACLAHCRNPLSYFLAHWRHGPIGGFRLGVTHGAYCVGCCWLIMLTGFAMGLMNLAWMALLTVVLAAEQGLPGGVWMGRAFGAGLIVWGAALMR